MKIILTLIISLVLLWSFPAMAQTPHVAEKAPPEKPFLHTESKAWSDWLDETVNVSWTGFSLERILAGQGQIA